MGIHHFATCSNDRVIEPIHAFKRVQSLVLGAANLFSDGRLSKGLEDIFKFYFVDFWKEKTKRKEDKNLTWESITRKIDAARIALGISQVAVLGQSAGGAIALEYFRQYLRHCFFCNSNCALFKLLT